MGDGGADLRKRTDKLYLISVYLEGRGIWTIANVHCFRFWPADLEAKF